MDLRLRSLRELAECFRDTGVRKHGRARGGFLSDRGNGCLCRGQADSRIHLETRTAQLNPRRDRPDPKRGRGTAATTLITAAGCEEGPVGGVEVGVDLGREIDGW